MAQEEYGRHFGAKKSYFGADTKGHDVKMFGDTTGKYAFWDASADTLYVVGTLSITGTTTLTGTFTVGVNDTGYDVKFFGATADRYFLWDESEDTALVIGKLNVGAFHSTAAGSGIPLSSSLTAAARVYADDGGAKLTGGGAEYRGSISRVLLATADTDASDHTVSGFVGQIKTAIDYSIGGNMSGVCGYLETAGSNKTITGTAANVISGVWGRVDVPSGVTIAASTYVSAFAASGNLGGTHTGSAVVLNVPNPAAGVWDHLLRLGSSAITLDGSTITGDLTPTGFKGIPILVDTTTYYIPIATAWA